MFQHDSLKSRGVSKQSVAKKSDHRAGTHEIDDSGGGTLSGLFAEENEFDRRAMLRVGTWGVIAVGAVVLAVMANQSQLGWRREQVAAVDLARQAHQIQSLTKESQNETRRLASAIDTLNSDRDRLFSRVTVIEQGLDSVTGAIRKNAMAEPPKPPPASTMPPSVTASESPPPPQSGPVQSQALPPTVAPVPVTAAPAMGPEKPRTEAAKSEPVKSEPVKSEPAPTNPGSLPQIAAIKPAVPLPGAILPAPAAPSVPPLGPAKLIMGPPDAAAPKLVESAAKPVEPAREQAAIARAAPSTRAAQAPATSPAAAPAQEVAAIAPADLKDKTITQKDQDKRTVATDVDEANSTIRRTEFAVELGGANSIGGLRALWRGLLKSNNAELAELRPIIVLRESNSGLGMQLRLAAGPLNDAAEAAKICASLVESKRSCETTVFDGQRLAMGADERQPASSSRSANSGKPARQQSYRHYTPKHAKKEDPPPPPKQESSTFSSLFGGGKK